MVLPTEMRVGRRHEVRVGGKDITPRSLGVNRARVPARIGKSITTVWPALGFAPENSKLHSTPSPARAQVAWTFNPSASIVSSLSANRGVSNAAVTPETSLRTSTRMGPRSH